MTERVSQTPDWSDWQLVRLEMPKPDGSLLNIEMLRPTEWLESQAGVVVESREIIAHPGPPEGQESRAEGKGLEAAPSLTDPNQLAESGSALRAESLGRADATESRATESLDSHPSFQPMPLVPESVPVGLVVEMDLPELGLTDLAWVTDLEDCPEIESGDGRVVTATFHHSSGDVIDLTVRDADLHPSALSLLPSEETIGTTSNHPFWSVDRQEYVQAGQLDVGERVLTFSGDTKRIVGKLPRPGPQPVYNLEVHAEHVYFVGKDGLLVHNAKSYAKIANSFGAGRSNLKGLAGDHVLPQQAIANAMAAAGVRAKSSAGKAILAVQDSARNLRLMNSRLNSSKGARNAVKWMSTKLGSTVPRRYIQNVLRKQYKNAQEINVMLNTAAGTKKVDYFSDFFNR